MVDSDSVHADSTLTCHGTLTDEDGEPITNENGNPKTCNTQLNGEDHATFVSNPRGEDNYGVDLRDRFTRDGVRWDCPNCGKTHWTCPVCYDEDGANGWFRGESTGELIACHNCNEKEAARQSRGAI